MATINGLAYYKCTVPGADDATFKLYFGVNQQPTDDLITTDETLCRITNIGDEVTIEFPTYTFPTDESLTYTIALNSYDTDGVLINTNSINLINITPNPEILYPDMAAGISNILPLTISPGGVATGDINLSNVGAVNSNGIIRFTIEKFPHGTTTYTLPSGFTLESDTATESVISTENIVLPGLANRVIFPFQYTNDGTTFAAGEIKMIIEFRSGGEISGANNTGVNYLNVA